MPLCRLYLQPAIHSVWTTQQHVLLTRFINEQKPLVLAGDGRSDSPGHCAKYGSYSVIELSCSNVLDFNRFVVHNKSMQSVHLPPSFQSNKVGGSYHMEKEGLYRLMEFLKGEGLQIGVLVIDRHKQINKWIRDTHPEVKLSGMLLKVSVQYNYLGVNPSTYRLSMLSMQLINACHYIFCHTSFP